MTQAQSLADALHGFFTNPESGWFTPLTVAIQDLTAEQAAQFPQERFNSIWGVVNHVRFWQEFMQMRLQGQAIDREALGGKNGWPPIPQSPTPQA